MENTSAKTHIVMLPFMARGHMIPFLALAKKIEERTHFTITIVSTPLNIQHLRATTSRASPSTINFAELPFCSSDNGLPPNSENTDSLHYSHIITLLNASQTLQPSFHHLISNMFQQEGRTPLCIISDVFMSWSVNVARSFDMPHFTFTTCGAFGTAAYLSIWLNLPHRNITSDEFSVPGFPETRKFHRSHLHPGLRNTDGSDILSRLNQKLFLLSFQSNGMLCNTVEEIEPMGIDVLRKNTGLPVWTIGPLLPLSLLNRSSSSSSSSALSESFSRSGKQPGISAENCVNWLNSHPPNSVLYISFGSQNTISSTQMMELAMGLELSGKPFIWVVRPPTGFDIEAEFRAEWLPEGFEERVRNRNQGMVVHRWAPQLEILSHGSTGAFLSHCGWNSTLESLSQGVPIIGWPIAGEQAYNSKMMEEEMGVCVVLNRGVESLVGIEEVERVVKMVMSKEGKGKEMKRKAMEIAEKIRDSVREDGDQRGSSLKVLDGFLETIV
ncbi:crocetin glucosyltransferase 3-like [Macadamia integrifolia]|uniref:crocetin glucosyltransferase 3-like n=1 Tax=Macadamia integrifolia TaxID=60698 RepID=UPI001C5330D0|nr:crocetin glucosyltransferase 3-like [Macadamia integrifolia]